MFENGAPIGWREKWNEPLTWPGEPGGDIEAGYRAFRDCVPLLHESVLVIIDIDKKSIDRQIEHWTAHDAAQGAVLKQRAYDVVLPNLIRLLEFFRARERPVVFVQWGWHRFQYPPLERQPGEDLVIKYARGAFGSSGIDALLRRKGVSTAVFAGADTIMCVASTVRGAIDHNYRAVLVEDACFSSLPHLHENVVATLGWHQAHIKTTSEILQLEG